MHNKSCANHLLALRKCENGLKRSRAAYGEGTQGKSDGEPAGASLRDGDSHSLLPRRAALHALRAAWGVLVEVRRPILRPAAYILRELPASTGVPRARVDASRAPRSEHARGHA